MAGSARLVCPRRSAALSGCDPGSRGGIAVYFLEKPGGNHFGFNGARF
jgi:hypothetical protein